MKSKEEVEKLTEVKPSGNVPIGSGSQPRNMDYQIPITESDSMPLLADDQTQRKRTLEWVPTENAPMIFLLKDILTELRLIRTQLTK